MKRFIRYLYEYEQGRRTRNVGFVKVEQDENACVVHVHGKGFRFGAGNRLWLSLFFRGEGGICLVKRREEGNVNPALNSQIEYTREEFGQDDLFGQICGVFLENDAQKSYLAVWDDAPVNLDSVRLWERRQVEMQKEEPERHAEETQDVQEEAPEPERREEQQMMQEEPERRERLQMMQEEPERRGESQMMQEKVPERRVEEAQDVQEEAPEPERRVELQTAQEKEPEPKRRVEPHMMQEKEPEPERHGEPQMMQEKEPEPERRVEPQMIQEKAPEPKRREKPQTMQEKVSDPVRRGNPRVMTGNTEHITAVRSEGVWAESMQEEPASSWVCCKIQRAQLTWLARREWRLANNQFLMHGYHNYHHLLLMEKDGALYLGVPGIYHRREARVAESFGFPEFIGVDELRVDLTEEERDGEFFGYWARRVRKV